MEITLESLHRFVRDHGTVDIVDTSGTTRKLRDGSADYWDLALKADKFHHAGAWYSRKNFEKYMDGVAVGTMKLKDTGKVHQVGNASCPSCDQTGLNGAPLSRAIRHYPYVDSGGNPPCGGLVHSEVFPDERGGCTVLYRCDRCGHFA